MMIVQKIGLVHSINIMTFEEFKKTCYHTEKLLRIPLLNTYVEKSTLINKRGKYDFDKEYEKLREIYEANNLEDK